VLPKNLVVDYWAKSLETAERVSEVLEIPRRVLKERQMGEIYLDVDLGDPVPDMDLKSKEAPPPSQDASTPYQIIEQHTFWDMDEDGYAEPYIITFERYSGKVLRIVARFTDTGIKMITNSKGEEVLAKIEPIEYYTKFGFIPNPEGGFYDIGFGLLLAPLNESVNTLINQLIDAGTISNLQAGFLGKGVKLRMGEQRFQPGEWKSVNSTSDDLRKQIIPLPTKDPSKTLLELAQLLLTSGKELASVAEIFVGKMPGQNTPATTTMATIEQGMKVFTAVYKRVYRSLRSEFKKLFLLNSVYLDSGEYQRVVDEPIDRMDFDIKTYDVCPGADPNTATATEKLMKAQGLMELLPTGVLDVTQVVTRILEAQEQPSYQELFSQAVQQTGQPAPPPPDPKVMALKMKQEADMAKGQQDMQNDAFKRELDARDQQFQHAMEAQKQSSEARHAEVMGLLNARAKYMTTQAQVAGAEQQHQQKMQQSAQSHAQDMVHKEEQGKLAIQQAKAMPKTPSKGGSKKP
jgi:chaperonin GroES